LNIDYIIVQAGGKGTRFEYLTANKPKALVPVDNLPILFHLFRRFPDKRFVIIADYKREVFRGYLESFADVKYQVVDALGTGTCAGLAQAASPVSCP
jgi:NDP-sugar pyrophosphorylase family protein